MQGKLQQSYRVSKELGQNSLFKGSIQLSQLTRLGSLVLPGEAEIQLTFEFTENVYRHPSIQGHIDTELFVECQRCLEPMAYTIDLDFDLLVDATDEDVQSFKLDTVYSEDGYIDIFEIVEDELILALPLISMHDDPNCNKHWHVDEENQQLAEKNNPFAVLKTLKGKT